MPIRTAAASFRRGKTRYHSRSANCTTTVATLIALLCSPLAISLLTAQRCEAAEQPNVLVILTDDQGWGDLSLNGNTNLQAPNVDSLARDGASFERFYVCAVCSPTRAEFLTGRYHPRTGVYNVSTGGERMDADEQTIANVFHDAGYATAAFGKWHNGTQHPYHPNARGFDEFYGFCSGHWGNYFSPMLDHNGQIVTGEGYATDDFTNRAIEFIEQHRERPFFVYLALNIPHSPMQVPDEFWDRFAEKPLELRGTDAEREDLNHTRAALAMCENIDWNMGRMLEALDRLDLADDTIVVYFCDNGPNGHRWNGGMRGIKGSVDEGGLRSPLLMRWPGHIEGGRTVSEISGAIDLLPTLAELAGVDFAPEKPLDGLSHEQALTGEAAGSSDDAVSGGPSPSRTLFSHWNGKVSARTPQYRIDDQGRMYDMREDPGQTTDIAAVRPEIAWNLQRQVDQWKETVLAELDRRPRPFGVGYGGAELTQLPARDAVASGGIQRSSRHPNCSFFTNWTSSDEAITWDVDVHTAGQYAVDIYYTCQPDDVGSTVELSFGESRLVDRVKEPNNPPLRGAEHDRDPRTESYVKDFRPLDLGTITLPQGRGQLTLKALEVAGDQVMDVRLLMLRLVDADE